MGLRTMGCPLTLAREGYLCMVDLILVRSTHGRMIRREEARARGCCVADGRACLFGALRGSFGKEVLRPPRAGA